MSGESRVIVTCMKNECPYILEWIAYHLHIGFTHFVVATNGCSDGTVRLLRNLEMDGIVTHVPNPPPHNRGPQKTGYFRCRDLPVVKNADWLMTLDADEFLNIYAGDGTLDALFATCPDANLFSFQWLLFGFNDVHDLKDEPVISQFTKAAHPLQVMPTGLRSFKTIYRNGFYQRLGTHRPNGVIEEKRDEIRWVDGSGNQMPNHYINRGWAGERDAKGLGMRLGRINHYAVRSVEGYMIKRDRGDVNPSRQHVKLMDTGLNYWKLHNWNEHTDTSILRHLNAVQSKMDEMKEFRAVRKVHDYGVEWHQTRAKELAGSATMQELRAALLEDSATDRVLADSMFRDPEPGMDADGNWIDSPRK